MPNFIGNLKDLGLDPRGGGWPILKFQLERAAVTVNGGLRAASTTVIPEEDGTFEVLLESTVGMVPRARVKLTGRWLSDDTWFELPPFDVPGIGGNLVDLIDTIVGNDVVYTTSNVVTSNSSVWVGFQLDTTTGDLYERLDS